ncbi:unnamed protein product [Cylindrotheca closterium]|uniref:Uncharacterized protein n=1 Tax=Cylindrotheca closterium TaxID=2856 RepID=A0AAD2FVM0_9STRA|nr:unnamed protein product [Cylindrotheca closterium]CAJ1954169.1 unnamed protein product [Cylindrotheca closterium]CAJ1954170.1 unnamed protein product [Cylindrotheca closterium]CAJ1954171.1 unnamed protein product [Cylindrotheca closterium]CAJ1954172.1 unnamed protein product [Cylindrotheca closterium]
MKLSTISTGLFASLLALLQTPTAFGQIIDYSLAAPTCAITADDNVQCDFASILPLTGNLAFSITGYGDCTGTATRDLEMSLSAATATAVAGASTVSVDLNTGFTIADGASEAFEFCLLTSLKDGSGNEMFYQGQKISATFTADGGFTVAGITSEQFDGISGTIATDTKTFGVTATRCDGHDTRVPISTPALALGTTLFICLDTDDDSVVIQSVDTFLGSKTNVASTNLLSGNTEVLGANSAAATVGTRPFSTFFADTDTIDIAGTVTLVVTSNNLRRRHLARILQTGADEFDVRVEVEPIEESSAPSSFSVASFAFLGAVAAVAAI